MYIKLNYWHITAIFWSITYLSNKKFNYHCPQQSSSVHSTFISNYTGKSVIFAELLSTMSRQPNTATHCNSMQFHNHHWEEIIHNHHTRDTTHLYRTWITCSMESLTASNMLKLSSFLWYNWLVIFVMWNISWLDRWRHNI